MDKAFADHPGWKVERTSCLGMCDRAPAALVNDQLAGPISFERVGELEKVGAVNHEIIRLQDRGNASDAG